MRRRLATVLAGALLATTSACGLPAHEVQRIDPDRVPFDLLSPAPSLPEATPEGFPVTIYLVSEGRLLPAHRRVIVRNVPAEAVRAVLDGPTVAEAEAGYTSDIPSQTRLISLDLTGTTATVDLSAEFGGIGGSQQVLAVAQIVFSLTGSRDISSVRFAIDGKPAEVPDASGSLSAAARTRADYRQLAPLHP